MGWTSYHATHYKKGKIDRKAECDAYFMEGLNRGHFNVLKSAMVGSTYYAAVQRAVKYVGKNENGEGIYESLPENERTIFGVVFLTSTNAKDWFNFSYKDIDETMGPAESNCPKGILDLLSPTESEYAIAWRKRCYDNLKKKRNPDALHNLPWGSIIEWTTRYDLTSGRKAGEKITLTKVAVEYCGSGRSRTYWSDGYYKIPTTIIGNDYVVIKRGR